MTDVWVGRLARFGLACRGVLYLVLAGLAINLARGKPSGSQADSQGAFETVAHHPFGHVLVLALAVGFGFLAVWQGVLAVRSWRGATGWKRVAAGAKALVYAALCLSALAVAAERGGSSGGNQQAVDVTGRVMRHTAGRYLVGVAGIVLAIGGVALIVKGVLARYDVEVHINDVPAAIRRGFQAIGGVGMCARGLVIALAGYFVIEAAVTFSPAHAKGLDGVLASVVHHPWGQWMLVAVALGLGCFGLFSLLEARYART